VWHARYLAWFSYEVPSQYEIDALYETVLERMNSSTPDPLVFTDRVLPESGFTSDVVLSTSGSATGAGRLVGLSWDALKTSAALTLDYLGGPGRWWLRLPTDRIAGFQIIVRSALAGVAPSLRPDGCDYASVVPTQLERDPDVLRGLKAILVGGAPTSALPKGLPLTRTYGMTETAGGCVYDGKALPGVGISVRGGRVFVSGPTLMDGYLDGPSPFVHSQGAKWLKTGDLGFFEGGVLQILGRADDVIISGGVNVLPEAVRQEILTAFPSIGVAVVGVPDPLWGEVVCAVYAGQADPHAISSAATGALSPRVVVQVESLPELPGGKVDRNRIKELVITARSAGSAWEK